MALYGTGQSFETAEDGTYICDLSKVSEEEGTAFGSDEKITQFKFVFTVDPALEPDGVDSKDKPYKFTIWTGTVYGGEKANLTKVVRGLSGRILTVEEFEQTDLEEFLTSKSGQKYKVTVIEEEKESKKKNKIISIKPYEAAGKKGRGRGAAAAAAAAPEPAPAAAADEEVDFGDPFADQ